jgi:hypothetical protein
MRNFLTIVFLLAAVALATNGAYAQKTKPKPKPTPAPVAPVKVELGKLSGNSYANDFFGLKFDFPLGWLVGDNVLEKQLKEIAEAQLQTTGGAARRKAVKQAIDRVTPLLGGYKKLPGMPENASLRVMVEDLSTLPSMTDGKTYLAQMLKNLKMLKMPADFKYSEIKTETIDNLPLDYIESSTGGAKKRVYATVRKKFAVLIAIDYYEDADFEALHKVLTEADLDYKPVWIIKSSFGKPRKRLNRRAGVCFICKLW